MLHVDLLLKHMTSSTSWRICTKCGEGYLHGFYKAHKTKPTHLTALTVKQHEQGTGLRICTVCGASYDQGTYQTHVAAAKHGWTKAPDTKQTARDLIIVEALDSDPYLTLQAVGDQYGVSRQRIEQIYIKAKGHRRGILRPLKKDLPSTCAACGQQYQPGHSADHYAETGHRPGEVQYKRNDAIVELYLDGLSSVQIGRIYGLAASYIGTILRRRGVTARSPKGRTILRKAVVDAERD